MQNVSQQKNFERRDCKTFYLAPKKKTPTTTTKDFNFNFEWDERVSNWRTDLFTFYLKNLYFSLIKMPVSLSSQPNVRIVFFQSFNFQLDSDSAKQQFVIVSEEFSGSIIRRKSQLNGDHFPTSWSIMTSIECSEYWQEKKDSFSFFYLEKMLPHHFQAIFPPPLNFVLMKTCSNFFITGRSYVVKAVCF
jgi:hypothetical protein